MEKKDSIYYIFHHLICNTPKVICCDGDISNREYEYIRRFACETDNPINIYENTYLPRKYEYVFHYDEFKIMNMIEEDLKNKLNIVFVSMSSSMCQKIDRQFNNKYNVLCITSKTDDNIKKQLIDLENKILTNNIQILIYSPCITVGTDISIKNYFNKIYGFMCNHSVTARDFNQMLARVRNPIDDTINILLDRTIPKSQIANYYEFDEVKSLYCDEYNYNINDLTTYQTLRLWNDFEDINNKHYLFPIFLHYITKKGHTYKITDECKKTNFEKFTLNEIILAENIDYDIYTALLEQQQLNDLSRKQKLMVEKFLYSYTFNKSIEDIDESFMKIHFGKRYIVKNNDLFMKIFKGNNIRSNKNINKYDNDELIHKMINIKKILNYFGFMDIDNQINKTDFETKYSKITDIIDDKFRLLFDMKKEEVNDLIKINNTNKKVLGFLNSLLIDYGVEIIGKRIKIYSKETKKQINTWLYNLDILNIIKNIPERDIIYDLID